MGSLVRDGGRHPSAVPGFAMFPEMDPIKAFAFFVCSLAPSVSLPRVLIAVHCDHCRASRVDDPLVSHRNRLTLGQHSFESNYMYTYIQNYIVPWYLLPSWATNNFFPLNKGKYSVLKFVTTSTLCKALNLSPTSKLSISAHLSPFCLSDKFLKQITDSILSGVNCPSCLMIQSRVYLSCPLLA